MYIFLTILIVIASILMIGVVLIQKSKGGGLAQNFSNQNQFMGVRKTTDFVEKTTWTLAALIGLMSIISAFFAPSDLVKGGSRIKQVPAQEQKATPFATEKSAPAAQAPATPAQSAK